MMTVSVLAFSRREYMNARSGSEFGNATNVSAVMPLPHGELPLDEVNIISSWVESMLFGELSAQASYAGDADLHRRNAVREVPSILIDSDASRKAAFSTVSAFIRYGRDVL